MYPFLFLSHSYIAYLYRVGSRTSVGVAYGPWIKARTSEGGTYILYTYMK